MPVPEPRRADGSGPPGGPLPWLTLYVLAVAGLVVWFNSLVAWEETIWVIAAALLGVSFLLGLKLGGWALLGPPFFCVGGFVLLVPLADDEDGDLVWAIGGWLVILGSALALLGVLAGLFIAVWRWTGRDD